MVFAPLGDSAVLVTVTPDTDLDARGGLKALVRVLRAALIWGVTDIVPAYNTIAVFYDAIAFGHESETPFAVICRNLQLAMERATPLPGDQTTATSTEAVQPRRRTIPVCYGGNYGPDLIEVAAHAKLEPADVIARHSGAEYGVEAIGFIPGFSYLSGLPTELAMPRQATPRTRLEAGSVGIGGRQTGIYPRPSPGGWRIIGRTPQRLFDAKWPEPSWLQVGDRVVFQRISEEEFATWK